MQQNKDNHDKTNPLSFYRRIFHESQVGMSVYDASGQCIEANEAIGRLIGAHREHALLQNYYQIESWKKYGLLKTALSAITENIDKHHEVSLISTFGRHITIDFHMIPFTEDDQGYLLLIASDVTERKKSEVEREKLIQELQRALSEVKILKGIIPICASCKKIRDDDGYWKQIEIYMNQNLEADFSHGICPDCAKKLYSDYDSNKGE